MKTTNENKKTNKHGNVKTSFQRFMILMVAIMVSTALVSCDIINEGEDPDDGNNGSTTTGKIDPELIGSWFLGSLSGSIYDMNGKYVGAAGVGSIYSFGKDGTFVLVIGSNYEYSKFEAAYVGKYRTKGNSIEVYSVTYESYSNGKISKDTLYGSISCTCKTKSERND